MLLPRFIPTLAVYGLNVTVPVPALTAALRVNVSLVNDTVLVPDSVRAAPMVILLPLEVRLTEVTPPLMVPVVNVLPALTVRVLVPSVIV